MLSLDASTKLDGQNYGIWKYRMESILVLHDCWDMVDGSEVRPTHQGRAQDEWDKKSKLALHLIKHNVQNMLLGQLKDIRCAKDAWDLFSTLFEAKNTARLLTLRNQINQSYRHSNESGSAYLLRVKELNNQLSSIGDAMKAEELVQVVLNGLGETYENFVEGISIQRESKTLDELQSLLIGKELRHQSVQASKGILNEQALAMGRGRGTSRGRGRWNNQCTPHSP